jgi:hypothetical protein
MNLGLTQAQSQHIIRMAPTGGPGSAAKPPAGGQPAAPSAPGPTGTAVGGNAT